MSDERQGGDAPTEPVPEGAAHATGAFAGVRPGTVFAGRYEVVARLGAGGTGEVFHVRDRLAGQHAALKLLFPRAEGSAALERLRRELRLVRALEHPGILKLHDIGERDGLFFLVMPLLEGETLRARIARGPLDPAQALRIAEGMLEALAAAHARGVVHRDVKPANVFLQRGADGAERVVLLDFGLARSPETVALTLTGQFLGTPEYVAPEQARGVRDVGPPADVYAAGIVLWEMLAGAPPFGGDSAIGVLMRQVNAPLPAVARALPGAPRWLRDLLLRTLEKAPARRFADAGAALAALRARQRAGLARRVVALLRRRAAWAALAVPAALALAWLTLWPARWVADGFAVRAASRAGVTVRRFTLPAKVVAVEQFGDGWWGARHALAALHVPVPDPLRSDGFPERLAELDVLAGAPRRFALQPDAEWRDGPPHGLPRYDRRMYATGLTRAHPDAPDGAPRFVATWNHRVHSPSVAAAFDAHGNVDWVIARNGALGTDVHFVTSSGGQRAAERMVLLHGLNDALGSRHEVFVVADGNGEPGGTRRIPAPPFDARVGPVDARLVTSSVAFLSDPVLTGSIDVEREVAYLASDRASLALGVADAVPRDAAGRDGLSRTEWDAARVRLVNLLLRAPGLAGEDRALDAAQAFSAFAGEARVARAQRGVALARAAELFRAAGRLDDGLAAARRALALEPALSGHARLVVDIASRAGRDGEVRATLDALGLTDASTTLGRDRVMAALLSDDPAEARRVAADPGQSSYGRLEAAWIALHEDRPDAALAALGRGPDDWTDIAFVRAVALARLPQPRCTEAGAALAVAESGAGDGWALPFVPLRAYLARRCGTAAPPAATLDAALAAQRAAAATNIVDRYMALWGERLARGVAREKARPAR